MVWAAVVGLVIGALGLIAIVTLRGNLGDEQDFTPVGEERPAPQTRPFGGDLVGDSSVPGVGGDILLAGGLVTIPVQDGWRVVTRGDRAEDPGGYPENAVLANSRSRVSIAVYLEPTTDPGNAASRADAAVRRWTRDEQEAESAPVERLAPSGSIAEAATIRYSYARGTTIDGLVVVAIRPDGVTLIVFVEARGTELTSTRNAWQPVQIAILDDFAA